MLSPGGGGHDNGSFCSSYNLFLWSLWLLARGIIRHVSNTASLLFLLYLVSLGLPKVNTTSVTTAVPKPSIVDIQYHVGSTCQKSHQQHQVGERGVRVSEGKRVSDSPTSTAMVCIWSGWYRITFSGLYRPSQPVTVGPNSLV